MPSSLATALGDASYSGKLIKVTFQLYANNGRSGAVKYVKIYTPRPILNLALGGSQYRATITNGNPLSSTGTANCAQIDQRARASQPDWADCSFVMKLDGSPLTGDDGFGNASGGPSFIVAFGGNGETVPEYPYGANYFCDGSRGDLYFGDPPDDRDTYPDFLHWVGSSVRQLDIAFTTATSEPLRSRLASQRQAFS